MPSGRSGGINIIDLANVDSCAFLETSDLGRLHPDGRFEVIGRFDNSEVRGCNLLAE
jgi:non-ribosomal peptide synthetase component F